MAEHGATGAIGATGKVNGAIGAIGKVKYDDGHDVGASLAYTPQKPQKIFGDNNVYLNPYQKNVSIM